MPPCQLTLSALNPIGDPVDGITEAVFTTDTETPWTPHGELRFTISDPAALADWKPGDRFALAPIATKRGKAD